MTDKPITINPSALPGAGAVIARYTAALLAGWLIRKGYLTGGDEELVSGLVLALATAGYAVYKSVMTKRQTVVLAEAAPDSVAQVAK